MKRLLLVLFLGLTPAAHAVDYEKCEAIQKALSRTNNSAHYEWKEAFYQARLDGKEIDEADVIDKADPKYLALLKRIEKIQVDYDAAA